MKKTLGFAIGAVALAMLAAPSANAATAYTTTVVNLRAGPGIEYPVVFPLRAGTGLETYGCLQDWSWCDVSIDGYRGWVYGGYLAYPYENGRVSVLDYGPRIGLPVITFVFGDYWDHNYRNRTFYRDRSRYESVVVKPYRPYRSTNTNFNRIDSDRTRLDGDRTRRTNDGQVNIDRNDNDRTRSFNRDQNNQINTAPGDKTTPPGQVKRNDTTPVAPPGQDKVKAVPPGQVQRNVTPPGHAQDNKGSDNRGAGNNNKGGNKGDNKGDKDRDDDQTNQGGPRR